MTKFSNFCAVVAAFFAVNAYGADFLVKNMRVEGLRRISDGTVFNYLPIDIGDNLNAQRLGEALRALYSTGLFQDVEFRQDQGTLIILVQERPTINKLNLTGNKQIKEDDLKEGLKDAGLAEGRQFDRGTLEGVEQELNRVYFGNGRYGVKIDSAVTELPNNLVDITIEIKEGKVAKIRQINMVGNSAYPDDELLDTFESGVGGLLSFYSKKDQYSLQKVEGDLESLTSYYMDRGYAAFEVESTQVSISPDKKDIFLTVNINEGDIYKVSDIKMAGDFVVPEEQVRQLVLQRPDTTFSRRLVIRSEELITLRLGNDGYAFAEVNAFPEFDEDNKTVSLTYFIDPKQRAYVRRINYNGVDGTDDEVFRREMRQLEGAWLSNSLVDRSKALVSRLPFVEDVQVETERVPGEEHLVDVNFDIKQRQSGTLSAGVGFSDRAGVLLNGGFTESNFLGTGDRLAVNLNAGSFQRIYSISHTDPYFTEDGISRLATVSYRRTDQLVSNASSFTSNSLGAILQFGFPLSDFQRVSLGAAIRDTELLASGFSPNEYVNWVLDNGNTFFREGLRDSNNNPTLVPASQFTTYELLLGWSRDTRNRAIFAERGSRISFSAEYTLPGSDVEYYVARASFGKLWPIFGSNWIFSWRGEYAFGDALGDTQYLPPNKNFFAGGAQSVRGYRNNRLTPLDSFGRPYGGNLLITNQLEIILPTPEKLRGSARISLFADAGNVFYTGDPGLFTPRDSSGVPTGESPFFDPEIWDFSVDELRYSVGVSATWLAPIGALTFSYGIPLNEVENVPGRPNDDLERFQFSVNSPF